MAAVPNGNNRVPLELIDEHEREPRNQFYRVLGIKDRLTGLFSVPENEHDLQWSTDTLKSLVDYVPVLQMVQVGGVAIRDMPLYVMHRILNEGDNYEEMLHGSNAIFPLMDTLYFVIENISLWLNENEIEPPMHQTGWCSQSEMIIYLCIIVFVALWVAYQVACIFRNNSRR